MRTVSHLSSVQLYITGVHLYVRVCVYVCVCVCVCVHVYALAAEGRKEKVGGRGDESGRFMTPLRLI